MGDLDEGERDEIMKLPQEFVERMQGLMEEEEYSGFIKALKAKVRIHSLRVNTLKISVEDFLVSFPYELESVPWCRQGFYLPKGLKASRHPYYYAGLYYLQDPSAMLPGVVLAPASGERILDLCAAPGGKSTQIAAAMGGKGLLVLNDINPKRTKALIKNVENFGVRNAVITNNDPGDLADLFPAYFDRVLIDAPCSGEGMFRREARLTTAWRRNFHPTCCVPQQRALLDSAAQMVAPGGRLVYSTCTFSPEENEGQVSEFLKRHPDFYLLPLSGIQGISPGRGEWSGDRRLDQVGRIWPHLTRGEGQFAAVFEREDRRGVEKKTDPARSPFFAQGLNKQEIIPFMDFCAEVGIEIQEGRFYTSGEELLLLPEELPDLSGLNVIRCGLLLGKLRSGRFVPSQALALALNKETGHRRLELPSDSWEVLKYLRGETLLLDERILPEKGWILVTTDGFPLGWAKRLGGLIKNNYPAAWRML